MINYSDLKKNLKKNFSWVDYEVFEQVNIYMRYVF